MTTRSGRLSATSWPAPRPPDPARCCAACVARAAPASRAGSPDCSTRRLPAMHTGILRRRALRLLQDEEHPLYVFSLTGKELLRVAEISRVSRDEADKLIGYQRPEVRRHVQDIVSYLDGERVL